jgi:adenylate kinase family enzyme
MTMTEVERWVCILGLPGSGKSALAKALCDAGLGVRVAAGDWLRGRASLGDICALYLLETAKTMDQQTFELFLSDATRSTLNGETLVIDGAPRTAAQVGWFADFVGPTHPGAVTGIYLRCPPGLATSRLRARSSRYGDGDAVASARVGKEASEIAATLAAFSKLWQISELRAASSIAELVTASRQLLRSSRVP